jgi:hypothetical protein
LATSDELTPEKNITVSAEIHMYFPKMTEQEKANKPRTIFKEDQYDFKDIKENQTVTTNFSFTNKGWEELKIYKVVTTCSCLRAKIGNDIFKPGEGETVVVSLDPKVEKPKTTNFVIIYTNDPINPEYKLKITSRVIEN